jgi:hypothetical protein
MGWNPGISDGIPNVAVVANVRDFGAKGDGATNDYSAFQRAINSITTGAVCIPTGTYLLTSPLNINKSLVLRGEGAEKTRLIFDLDGSTASSITVRGKEGTGPWINMVGGYTKGSTTLSLNAAAPTAFQSGSFAVVRQANDPGLMYTDPRWKQDYAEHAVGQVVKVVSRSGNALTIEEPLRMGYNPSLSPQIRELQVVQYAGIEGLHLRRRDRGDAHMIEFGWVAYCWVRQVESEYAYRTHVYIEGGYGCEVRDNYIHHGHDYGGGGHGYGVDLIRYTTKVLVENNIFVHLRHSMMAHVGATGNVFGYNYSREPYTDTGPLPDISLHGHYPSFNLFEGNIVQEIGISDYWGPVGPENIYFRNRVETKDIFVKDHSHLQNIMANELVRGRVTVDKTVSHTLIHGNLINSKISWDPAIPDRTWPASFYYSVKPAFYGGLAWPSVGADNPGGTNPALDRYNAGRYIP